MIKMIVLAGLVAFASCSKEAITPEGMTADAAMSAADAGTKVVAADGFTPVGEFMIATPDNKIINKTVKADGTYIDILEGEVIETGTWNQKASDTYCFTKNAAGTKEVCNTEVADHKGRWRTTSPDGKTATVLRIVRVD